MKIAVFTPNFPPEKGACSARIAFLCRFLNEKGHHVRVYTFLPNYPQGKIFSEYRRKVVIIENYFGISVRRYAVFPAHTASFFPRIIGLLSMSLAWLPAVFSAKKFKPDLTFVQSPPVLPALLALRFSGTKKVLNVSDLWPGVLRDLEVLKRGPLMDLQEFLEKKLYRSADFFVGQSDEILQYLQQKRPEIPAVLHRSGVDCRLFSPEIPSADKSGKKKFRLVYAGLLGAAQALAFFCRQTDFFSAGVELHIYGEGFEKQELSRFISARPEANIFLHPAVSHREVPAVLRQYDAVLAVQKKTIFGTVPSKIYEAMAVGLPVLLTGGGESADLLRKAEAGLVSEPGDTAGFLKNLQELAKNPEECRRLGANGRAFALQFLDKEKSAIELCARLEDLVR